MLYAADEEEWRDYVTGIERLAQENDKAFVEAFWKAKAAQGLN